MTRPHRRATATGVLLAAAGAVAYGVTVVVGRHLAEAGLGSATALGARFGVAAVILAAILWLRGQPLCPAPGEWVRLLLLGAIGYATESTLFFLALQQGTAAACALLFYTYPALVCAIDLFRGRERLSAVMTTALGLSVCGTTLVVASGGRISIPVLGLVCALGSALVYAFYLLVGRELGRHSDAMVAACWIAVGSASSSLARGTVTGGLSDPSRYGWTLLGYGAATAVAFWLTFLALGRIGASRTAVVMGLEAVTAVVLGALLLGERLAPPQLIGGAAIVAAAAMIAASPARRTHPYDRARYVTATPA